MLPDDSSAAATVEGRSVPEGPTTVKPSGDRLVCGSCLLPKDLGQASEVTPCLKRRAMSNIADIRCRPSSTRRDGKSTSTQAQGCCIQSLVTFQRSRRRKRSRKPAQRLTIAYHDRGGRGQRARRGERDQASRQFVIIQGEPIEMATPAGLAWPNNNNDLYWQTDLRGTFDPQRLFGALANP